MAGGVGGIGGPGGGGKIGGPGPVAPQQAPKVDAGDRPSFGDVIARTGDLSRPAHVSPLDRLRRGEIDRAGYVDARVHDATAHLAGILPPRDLEKIRAELQELIETDPDVAALVKAAETGA